MSILELYAQDRPREKLIAKGHPALSDVELLQVVIGSGIRGADVIQISKEIYALLEANSGKISFADLIKVKGVSVATASKLVASFELAHRFTSTKFRVLRFDDILPLISDIRNKRQEHFLTITLDGAQNVIERRIVAIGILNASMVHPREVFADAICDRAASIIVAHNHPSGSLSASEADMEVTRRLASAGELLGIPLVDHVVITQLNAISIYKANKLQ